MEDDVISHTQDVWLGRISAGKSHSTMYTLNFWYSYAKYVAATKLHSLCNHISDVDKNIHESIGK